MAVTNHTSSFALYYPHVNSNLSQITWAHAVNTTEKLSEVLKDPNIVMLEADVAIGTIYGTSGPEIPIIAHIPNKQSDVSLKQFLERVRIFSEGSIGFKKGVKLDFKTVEVLEAANSVIVAANVNYPFMISADIVSGSTNSIRTPIDPNRFFAQIKNHPKAILSLGWTARYDPSLPVGYTSEEINAMWKLVREHNVTQEITFAVIAELAAESVDLLKELLEKVDGSTLTVWSGKGCKVDVNHLRLLIETIGLNKVFVDVGEDLLKGLGLDEIDNFALKKIVV